MKQPITPVRRGYAASGTASGAQDGAASGAATGPMLIAPPLPRTPMPPDADDVLEALVAIHLDADQPVVTAPEIADHLDASRRTVHDRLRLLQASGDVESHEIARGRGWWATDLVHVGISKTPADSADARSTTRASRARESGAGSAHADATEIEKALMAWTPGRNENDRRRRRQSGKRILEWLRDHAPERYQGQHIRSELADDLALDNQSPNTWWKKIALPALKHAADYGLVEYREGHYDYRWTGAE